MNLPNKLTCLRMIMVPFFVAAMVLPFAHHYLVALVLFAAASFTDLLDGKIARKYNLVTEVSHGTKVRHKRHRYSMKLQDMLL